MVTLSIHPLFVFDGPNKPPFKRNKRTGVNVASIPEFLAKQLLKKFGLPFHIAPGEAEAECALLQRQGIVDAVLSEDVDTLMFGSGLTLRNWSAEGTLAAKTPTHVNVYDATKTKETSGLDREGMILVALMSGGDYIPEGIPGCGPKTACQAARAGFGRDLCAIRESDDGTLASWKERLKHELITNESKYFQRKSKALVIPEDFPRRDILRYYTHPCLSSDTRLENLRNHLKWDQQFDFDALRTFTGEAFEWICLSGAKKFIRNLAPAVLIRELRLRGEEVCGIESDDSSIIAKNEATLIKTIYKRRTHATTDNTPELRVDFIPHSLVPIDLEAEDPDPELPLEEAKSDDEAFADIDAADDEPSSPKKKRGPSTYDPMKPEKMWIPETYVKVGVPLKVQDWEESLRNAQKYEATKAQRKRTARANPKSPGSKSGMRQLTLPLQCSMAESRAACSVSPTKTTQAVVDLTSPSPKRARPEPQSSLIPSVVNKKSEKQPQNFKTVDIRARAESDVLMTLPDSVTKRRKRSPIRRAHTIANPGISLAPPATPTKFVRKSSATSLQEDEGIVTPRKKQSPNLVDVVDLAASPSVNAPMTPRTRQRLMTQYLSPSPQKTVAREVLFESSANRILNFEKVSKDPSSKSSMALNSKDPSEKESHLATEGQINSKQHLPLTKRAPTKSKIDNGPNSQDVFTSQAADQPTSNLLAKTFRRPVQVFPTQSEHLLSNSVNQVINIDMDDISGIPPENTEPLPSNDKTGPPVPRAKNVIRIRESLNGTWALEASSTPQTHSCTISDHEISEQRKRKSSMTNSPVDKVKAKGKKWRISQVETLDLTSM